jgi:hypothetical protein
MAFSAMLAEESRLGGRDKYILVDISLSAASWSDFSSQRHLKFIPIETNDGEKGTIIDTYGLYHDAPVTNFVKLVNKILK